MPKIKPSKIVVAVVCILALAVTAWFFLKPKEQPPQYITSEVSRGDIRSAGFDLKYAVTPRMA